MGQAEVNPVRPLEDSAWPSHGDISPRQTALADQVHRCLGVLGLTPAGMGSSIAPSRPFLGHPAFCDSVVGSSRSIGSSLDVALSDNSGGRDASGRQS